MPPSQDFSAPCASHISALLLYRGPEDALGEAFNYSSAWAQLAAIGAGQQLATEAVPAVQPAATGLQHKVHSRKTRQQRPVDPVRPEAAAPLQHASAQSAQRSGQADDVSCGGSSQPDNDTLSSAGSTADSALYAAQAQLSVERRLFSLPAVAASQATATTRASHSEARQAPEDIQHLPAEASQLGPRAPAARVGAHVPIAGVHPCHPCQSEVINCMHMLSSAAERCHLHAMLDLQGTRAVLRSAI